jgi:hypothetical protein
VIINIDESIVRSTNEPKYSWQRKEIKTMVTGGQRMNQVSLIMAVSNKGEIYFTSNRGMNNSLTIILFLQKLTKVLDENDPGWREYTTLLLDNAPYHKGCFFTDSI